MLYADGVRKLRQREYDHSDLYNDMESAQARAKGTIAAEFYRLLYQSNL